MITWLVLARDVSDSVSVQGEAQLEAAMILDFDTGLVRGLAIETDQAAALERAMTDAVTRPAAELPPGRPTQVLCDRALRPAVRAALMAAGVGGVVVQETPPNEEADAIFESFLAHMTGRPQPVEPPRTADWETLLAAALAFRRAEVWTRWSDERELAVELQLADVTAEFTAIVMGQAGVQHGLAVYPGDELPAYLSAEPGEEEPPPGTILLFLDAPAEVPADVIARAERYGWPAGDDLVPFVIVYGDGGPTEVGREDARLLAAVTAAVTAFDGRGPVSASAGPVTGSARVGDRQTIRYRAWHRARPDESGPQLRMTIAGHDLVRPGQPVTLGHLAWDALPYLSSEAAVYRPAPSDAPPPRGDEVPLIVIHPTQGDGPLLAAKVAELDPYGATAVDAPNGERVLVLAGGGGSQILMQLDAKHPALLAYERRLRATKGRSVVLVADAESRTERGGIYGMFECHQSLTPPSNTPATRHKPTAKAAARNRSGKKRR
ncbi:MAG: hypothetical protein ACTHMS_01375 [Jatrophihabitans sp.]|uniref:hypothetical protein n=1 Tax=Jatrophihabitans sp. TaxID=1932789 RepID=UPI003F7FF364